MLFPLIDVPSFFYLSLPHSFCLDMSWCLTSVVWFQRLLLCQQSLVVDELDSLCSGIQHTGNQTIQYLNFS